MELRADDICRDLHSSAGDSADDLIEWQQRYEGVLVVAYLDGKAVAGISGPWPGNQYALTWWDRPVPARQLELFSSLAEAQKRVEEWAWRLRTAGLIDRIPAANDPIEPDAVAPEAPPASWLSRIGRLFGNDKPVAPRRLSRADVDNLRYPPLQESDLHGIHFAAVE